MPTDYIDNPGGGTGVFGLICLMASGAMKVWNEYAPSLTTINEGVITLTAALALVLLFYRTMTQREAWKLRKIERLEKEKCKEDEMSKKDTERHSDKSDDE